MDTSTFTLTDRPGQAHTKPSHIPTVENISHTLLFFLKVHLTHTHTSRHMQKCGHTSYKHAICTEWHVCVQNYTRGETVQ